MSYYKKQKPIVICNIDGKEKTTLLIDSNDEASFMLFVIPSTNTSIKLYTKRYDSDMNNKDINLLDTSKIYSNN